VEEACRKAALRGHAAAKAATEFNQNLYENKGGLGLLLRSSA
jgi:hypothetical protein